MCRRVLSNLSKKFGMLLLIFGLMFPQERSALLGDPSDRIEFVISHDRHGRPGFTHGARNSQHFQLLRATIYKIANEDHLPC
ncbi:hypothetical protein BF49_0778 [Bradyrhizobium sp.]|nr:hypothetical protein BF49_0778 [Bradyrhizobium sp.]